MKTNIYSIDSIRLGVAEANIRKKNHKDLVLIEMTEGTQVAAVFTQNRFSAAPVIVAKEHIDKNKKLKKSPRYLLINTGYANACMGKQGVADSKATCQAVAKLVGCIESEVLPFSTGIIGEALPLKKIISALPAVYKDLSADNWQAASEGILTTDTCTKLFSRQIKLDGKVVSITGIAKGAGMIKPNMATMLSYIATDANVSKAMLNKLLKTAVGISFNRITVDGDTSTNDACVLMATGKAENVLIKSAEQKTYNVLSKALNDILVELAQAIIRDAEGATKFITLQVNGGKTEKECLQAAYAVAESPLVKTAFFASDPNWGRIVAAIGRCGINDLDCNKIKVTLDNVLLAEKGAQAKNYKEAQGQKVMDQTDITITIHLGRGKAKQTVWTSDLSHDYIKINAEYRS